MEEQWVEAAPEHCTDSDLYVADEEPLEQTAAVATVVLCVAAHIEKHVVGHPTGLGPGDQHYAVPVPVGQHVAAALEQQSGYQPVRSDRAGCCTVDDVYLEELCEESLEHSVELRWENSVQLEELHWEELCDGLAVHHGLHGEHTEQYEVQPVERVGCPLVG